MRIGEFARKHDITQDTVRHYLEMGLLVSEKYGGQYWFTEEHCRDMQAIVELKQLDFSLSEIQKILGFQRLTDTHTNEYRNHYLSFLEEKNQHVAKELRKYNKMDSYLKDKINGLKINEANKAKRLGFPMSSIGLLQCPNCREQLDVYDGTIEKNMIIEANISCECGYGAVIQNGIYIDEKAVRKKMQYGKPMLSKREYLDVASPNYINFHYKGISMLVDNVVRYGKKPKYIMELSNCVGFFLMQYIKHLDPGSTCILIDYDKDRISALKRDLEAYYEHKNFIFLCCNYEKLPLANSSVDVMVDLWMTKEYAQSNNQFLLDKVLPFLKEEGLFTGSYHYFSSRPNNFENISLGVREYFSRDNIMEKLLYSNLEEIDVTDIGPIVENNPYNVNIRGKELYQAIYAGQKRSVIDFKSAAVKTKVKQNII